MANKKLEVYYKGIQVGVLAQMPDKRIAFQYSDNWRKNGFSISPFSLPLKNDVFVPSAKTRDYQFGLFGVFADSLPDNWGNLLLDRYLLSIGVKRDDIDILDRLAYVGNSGMGALEYYPAKESDFNIETSSLNYDEIARECNNILSSKPSDKLDLLYKIAGSSGGTRPKILIKENGEHWIVKFPAKTDLAESGRIEYEYSKIAKQCKIHMTECELLPSKMCGGYFKTKRFDRDNEDKIFSLSFAGILEADFHAPCLSYSDCMKLVQILTKDLKADKEQMFRTMCFNVLAHNLDDHAKNFSFLYTEFSGWRLSPMYDLTYSETYWGEHTTSINGKGKEIADADLVKIGTDAGMKKSDCADILDGIRKQTGELAGMLREYQNQKNNLSLEEKLADLQDSLDEPQDNTDSGNARRKGRKSKQ